MRRILLGRDRMARRWLLLVGVTIANAIQVPARALDLDASGSGPDLVEHESSLRTLPILCVPQESRPTRTTPLVPATWHTLACHRAMAPPDTS